MNIVLAALIGYLLGSIPWGLLLTQLAGRGDVRNIGSGSIGATNVLRTGSKTLAALTLALDLAKGFAAVMVAGLWGAVPALAAAGFVVLGHMFPVWLGFRGGKGGATGLGVLLALSWQLAVLGALVWLAMAVVFRYSSLATLTATAVAGVFAVAMLDIARAVLVTVVALLIIARHHENIQRLLSGTESRISFGKA